MAGLDHAYRAAAIVRDAGGYIVGRTKLQKIAYFLPASALASISGISTMVRTRSSLRPRRSTPRRSSSSLSMSPLRTGAASIRHSIRVFPQILHRIRIVSGSRMRWSTRMRWSLNSLQLRSSWQRKDFSIHGPRPPAENPTRLMPVASTRRSSSINAFALYRPPAHFPRSNAR